MNTALNEKKPRRRAAIGLGLFGVLALVLVVSLLLWSTAAFFAPTRLGYYPAYGFFPFGFLLFPFGSIFFLFIIFFIFRFLFWGWGGRHYDGYRHYWGDAAEILRQRYARGEITKEQFEQMMRDLEAHR